MVREVVCMDLSCDTDQNATCTPDIYTMQHPYEDIVQWYSNLAHDFEHIAKFFPSIRKSFEGRDMPAVHFTGPTSVDKLTIYFQCQIHASEFNMCTILYTMYIEHLKLCVMLVLGEWISGAVCMYIANYLCENYGKNDQVRTGKYCTVIIIS